MARHSQLSRQQLTDLLDDAFKELEALKKMIAELYSETGMPDMVRAFEADRILIETQIRIKALLDHLAEYK